MRVKGVEVCAKQSMSGSLQKIFSGFPFLFSWAHNNIPIIYFVGEIVGLLRGFVSMLGWRPDMDAVLKEAGANNMVRHEYFNIMPHFP